METRFISWPERSILATGDFPTEHIKIGEDIVFTGDTGSLKGVPPVYTVKHITTQIFIPKPTDSSPKPEAIRCIYIEPTK